MKRPFRYMILVGMVLICGVCNAWAPLGHETVAVIATQHITPKAKAEYDKILATNLKSIALWLNTLRSNEATKYTSAWHTLHLDSNGQSTTTAEGDAVVQIERCANILRNASQHSDSVKVVALRTLVHLVADMHCIGHVRIEGEPLTNGFRFFFLQGMEPSEKNKPLAAKWYSHWQNRYFGYHQGFSAEMYARDMELCCGKHREEYMKGTPRDWAADMGQTTRAALEGMEKDVVLNRKQLNLFESYHERCLAKAGYRLAALLNDIFK